MTRAIPTVPFSPAKAKLSELLTEVFHQHAPRVIERHHGKERAVLLRPDDLLALLESDHRLSVEVAVEKEAVTVVLRELGLLGLGPTVAEAMADLQDELRPYVSDYVERFAFYMATDRRDHAAAVIRLALTPEEDWPKLLLEDSRAADPRRVVDTPPAVVV